MKKKPQHHTTELNEYDRKILNEYSRFHTNFIESNTAKNEVLENENFEGRK
ncbi:MAG TPA: hypothetical protein VF941_17935 [Clostridia bacterium]